jgi:peptidoglycan/LPS O-acetylase OafA/YrhL
VSAARVTHFDFVKGTLVLLMVLYHWLNYYIGLEWGGYRYLRFLTPAFIFITGFLVSHIYLQRYAPDDPRLHRRLASRGLKLLLLFIGLNLVAEFTIGGRLGLRSLDMSTWLTAANEVFIKGSPLAAFDVLVSIAYFLVLAPLVLLVSSRLHVHLWVLAAVAVVAVAMLAPSGRSSAHVEMLAIASIGLAAGASRHGGRLATLRGPAFLVPAYLLYVAAITWWNTPFLIQTIGVVLNLLVIDAVAVASGDGGVVQRRLIRIGQYSLFAYIAQIAVLQLLRRTLAPSSLAGLGVFLPFLLALAITTLAVELTEASRAQWRLVDRLYRTVFG